MWSEISNIGDVVLILLIVLICVVWFVLIDWCFVVCWGVLLVVGMGVVGVMKILYVGCGIEFV